jgi:hypothetical protein
MKIVEKLNDWYRGKYIPPPPDRISPGRYEKPFLAKCADCLARFWMRRWRWILMFLAALAAIYISLK